MFSSTTPIYRDNQTTSLFAPGAARIYSFHVADSSKPVRFTLVWTDPPGVTNPALVNNLDLTVTINGIEYRGNNFTNGVSVAGGSYSTIDNVENVFLPAGIPVGTIISVNVRATALNGDGIPGNSDTTDQTYSLVGYNTNTAFIDTIESPADFDGDRRTDVSIFRPSNGQWWYLKSSDGNNAALAFGTSTDKLTPADFTGDLKTDIAFWRPSTGFWFILRSENNSFYSVPFGTNGDIPLVGDFDGDFKADQAVFRPSNATWYIQKSTGGTAIVTFGANGDTPVPADFDGDGLTDIAIYRPSVGQWWIQRSSSLSVYAFTFGVSTDKPVQGDYTGDGKAEAAFFRPSTGEWFFLRSENSSFYSVPFGASGDIPSPGDYDGDGKLDTAVFRPSNSTWFVNRSTAGSMIVTFGTTGDVSVPNAFVR